MSPAMSLLLPMSPAAFDRFMAYAVPNYAEANVAAGRWKPEEAPALARAAFAEYLPRGQGTPDHHFFEIRDPAGTITVGELWVGVMTRDATRMAFIFEIRILPEYRRQGHASRALKALESVVRKLGLSGIGLHVFGYNLEAQALYRKLGYSVLDLNMVKKV